MTQTDTTPQIDQLTGALMHITETAVSLNVADVTASAEWVKAHLGFTEVMGAEGVVALAHPEAGFQLIYLQTGLPTFKPASAAGPVDGLLVVFTVDDIDDQYARLQGEGVTVITPIETEPWGERYFQMADPNGVIYQLVQWVQPTDPQYAGVAAPLVE